MRAGGRPKLVQGTILLDGRGLAGGGTVPRAIDVRGAPDQRTALDPFALIELAEDLRPPDYAASFAKIAREASGLDTPISVCTGAEAAWIEAVLEDPGAKRCELNEALSRYGDMLAVR